MFAIAYHFPVLPRHRDAFRHAWQAAHHVLAQTIGLHTHDFVEPRHRRDTFTLRLAWDDPSSFERFTRTWVGVWLLNGMGLARDAFSRPIETHVDGT
ncbi:MAG: hypothetical protein J0I76_09680 [Thiobacillus sp.]|nr:hypothetical protein [Thiobacillus sp.]MBN8766586.1 hypothetical protein [Thiobacillus sp.]MBN8774909.1 hypothetical protein [Thiobacillus sp.]